MPVASGVGSSGADCGGRGELDEEELARLDGAAERRDLPARAGCGCVLDRPAADVDRRSATIEQLDEVVRIRRAAVAAARVHLADDHVGGGTLRRRHDQQRAGEEEGKDESSSMHGLLRLGEGHDHPSGTGRRGRRNCPFANRRSFGALLLRITLPERSARRQGPSRLQRQDARRRLLDTCAERRVATRDGEQMSIHGRVRAAPGEKHQIRAGANRALGDGRDRARGQRRPRLERVGHDDTPKAELPTEEALDDRAATAMRCVHGRAPGSARARPSRAGLLPRSLTRTGGDRRPPAPRETA